LQLRNPISKRDIANELGNVVEGDKILGAKSLHHLTTLSEYFTEPVGPGHDSIQLVVQVPGGECQPFAGSRSYPILTPSTLSATAGYKRSFSQILESAPQPTKRRKLEKLPGSTTIYKTEPAVDQPSARLPSIGAGFTDLTTYFNLIAADKTPYIEMLDAREKYQYLFLRPSRFGKSVFLQTLASYYDKRLEANFDQIFGGLYIGKHRTEAASKYLVLCFDFSRIEVLYDFDKMERSFHSYVHGVLSRFLTVNSKFLVEFDKDHELFETNAGKSLENVVVRNLLWPSRTPAKLDVI